MAKIIDFSARKDKVARKGGKGAPQGPARILLFQGVRYERLPREGRTSAISSRRLRQPRM